MCLDNVSFYIHYCITHHMSLGRPNSASIRERDREENSARYADAKIAWRTLLSYWISIKQPPEGRANKSLMIMHQLIPLLHLLRTTFLYINAKLANKKIKQN